MKIKVILLITTVPIMITLFPMISAHSASFAKGLKARALSETTIVRTSVPYTDWNTGMKREREDIKVFIKGKVLDQERIRLQLGKAHPELVKRGIVFDAVKIDEETLLVLISGQSEGTDYPLIVVRPETMELINLDESHSQYNWFPPSRLTGRVRVKTQNGNQFMIQLKPLKVINIGGGEVVSANYPLVQLVDHDRKNGKIVFKSFDLEKEKVSASLELDSKCYKLPRFSFDHPKIDNQVPSGQNDHVSFGYGPTWWEKNIEVVQGPAPRLELKKTHVLSTPPPKVYSVIHGEGEIERVPQKSEACVSNSGIPEVESILAVDFCLGSDVNVEAALKEKICGKETRELKFSTNNFKISELTLNYSPVDRKQSPLKITTLEIEMAGKKYLNVQDDQLVYDYISLNENQALLKARSSGPWVLYLLSSEAKGASLREALTYAYPGSDFEHTKDGKIAFIRSSGVVIRKDPFALIDYRKGFITGNQDLFITWWVKEERSLELTISDWNDAPLKTESFKLTLFKEIPSQEWTVPKREEWFKRYFTWEKNQLKLTNSLAQ